MDKQVVLPGLYALQQEIEDDPSRFKVLDIGRRWGKTFFLMRQAFKIAVRRYLKTGVRQRGWIVAPTFPLVREDWLSAEHILKDAIINKHQTEMRMDFGKIGFIEFKSAEREDEGLRGAGLDFALCDECSRISQKSLEQGIFPALADKQGEAIFVSTPKGRNYFYNLFLKGKAEKGWRSWQYPTYTNPYFPQVEWERLKSTTPEMILKQEYEADFLEDEATVFKNISKCIRGKLEDPIPGEYYTIGIDLGRTEDFTVITVVRNSTASVVAIYRTNKIDWAIQKNFIKSVCSRYKKHLAFIDSTGLGDPIEDDLRRGGVNTKAFKFTQESKQELVEQLIVAIEQGLIGIPNCKETEFLIDEIKSFTYEVLKSGRLRYEAPSGLHDDGVMSLGLAIRGISHLLYKKAPVAPKPKRTMQQWTANEWDEFYSQIDKACKDNPFQTREQAIEGLKRQRYISMLERHM